MNEAIKRIKNAALAMSSDKERKEKYVLDTDNDEEIVANLMSIYLDKEIKTTSHWCRWDAEGEGVVAEVKSRTYGKDYDTWIIDTYKIDYLLDKFPDKDCYFVNVFEGEYHMYDAKFVASCPQETKMARFRDGKQQLRTYYVMPKDGYVAELKQATDAQ